MEQYVADDQNTVVLSPEGEMSGRMPWRLDHSEVTNLVAVLQDSRHRVSGAGKAP